jgi:hypothetical protein
VKALENPGDPFAVTAWSKLETELKTVPEKIIWKSESPADSVI